LRVPATIIILQPVKFTATGLVLSACQAHWFRQIPDEADLQAFISGDERTSSISTCMASVVSTWGGLIEAGERRLMGRPRRQFFEGARRDGPPVAEQTLGPIGRR